MDGAFDLLGGETLAKTFGVVKRGRKVASIAELPEPVTAWKDSERGTLLAAMFWATSYKLRAQAKKQGVTYRLLFMHPSGTELAELATQIETGRLTPVIDKVFPFGELKKAFAYLESGRAKGKVVIKIS